MSHAKLNGQKANGHFSGTIAMNGQPTAFNGKEHFIFRDGSELEIYSGEEIPGVGWKSITLKLAPDIPTGKHNIGTFSSFRSAVIVPANTDILQNYSGTLEIKPDHTNRHYQGTLSLTARNNGSNTYQMEATFHLKE
ncbi:hypothetical protein [Pseudomonas sp. R3-52-08]|uniref:hypothetical protein n=1 Tax=Pseudomonas sp. R3-52-08 TaxID=1173284 RepID=UPI000F57308F|nr:hypothetical protein [Pseudomonas sp. R3-52-08]AZF19909.1 hypothetical protein C4J91_1143 [Pseudomonas sp. R3-52-08]